MTKKESNRKSQEQLPTSSIKTPSQEKLTKQEQTIEIPDATALMIAAGFSGPIPPPEIIEKYNEVVPGAADRIITMAEKEANHRHDIDKKKLKERTRGQWFAAILTLAAFFLIYIALINNRTLVASIIAGSTIIGLAAIFITGSFIRKSETQVIPTPTQKS